MGYFGGNVGGSWNNNYCGNYEYGNNNGYGSTFALIVVLFILLIIVGATFINSKEDC
ncbi:MULTISPECIES: YjcZ family sporulation protein [Lysinibacillus]|uniref:YjcZ family sporulation protein n=2 Tax=Lysinibacillus TaxID=400634 RepID=A0A2S5CXB3_LYSSH|nr:MULTISPECIES: YjcZ family sporulation protein [Lysinibacillus]AHN22771.1 hypothetical protein T479_16690 [Lysinibacillus varians]POZ55471.1 hypothetical protein LYSIN_00254 [Lysinibacillus sphaericus]TKI66029.1 YjcZ family sporulation protein [Lysinibacillus varians]